MAFSLAATPELHFGAGKISVLPAAIKRFGAKILFVTGGGSFMRSVNGAELIKLFNSNKITFEHISIDKEPSPQMIDVIVEKFSSFNTDVIVAVGGGSVLDAGKAISAMIPLREKVKKYLEGVGKDVHPGVKLPFIAIPTTAGTGSEVTKNAVLSETGEHGFKKSLRHINFVPNVAIVDPSLTTSCPPSITAASGMDAFTQLLESYLSTAANPVTDALALEGLKRISHSMLKVFHDGSDIQSRTDMALAAYLSGVTLANAGLGLVHGFASSVGGFFEIPHGVICSSLMPPANKITVRKLREKNSNDAALIKYSNAGRVFSSITNQSREYYTDFLLDLMEKWVKEMNIPALEKFGVHESDYKRIADVTDNKNNPIAMETEEMIEILSSK